jgi:hypothetical protein
LKIEETTDGVVLSPASNPSVSQDEVFGCLKPEVSKRVSLKEMDQAIAKLARSSAQ